MQGGGGGGSRGPLARKKGRIKRRGGGSRRNLSPVSISTRGSPHLKSSNMDAAFEKHNGGSVTAADTEEAGGRVNVADLSVLNPPGGLNKVAS